MTYNDLINKAIALDCCNEFIDILNSEPIYPIQYTDHDVPEFGKKVVFIGDENTTGMKHGEIGYILGIARHKKSVGRPVGLMGMVIIDARIDLHSTAPLPFAAPRTSVGCEWPRYQLQFSLPPS